jgi:hypothetical protein
MVRGGARILDRVKRMISKKKTNNRIRGER